MSNEPNHFAIFVLIIAAARVFIVAISVAIARVDASARDGGSKVRCGIDGGKVEFYDRDHDELWRCVRAERVGT